MTRSTLAGGRQLRPDPLDDRVVHGLLGRSRQDPAVDLDGRLAGDDVVLHPGVDDVRADRVAQERADGPRRHRIAEGVERGLGQAGILAGQRPEHAGPPRRRGWSAAPRKNSAIVAVSRGGPWTLSRATIWAARTAALSSRGIEPWPHVPRTLIR